MRYFIVFHWAIGFDGNDYRGYTAWAQDSYPSAVDIKARLKEQFGMKNGCPTNIIELSESDYKSFQKL